MAFRPFGLEADVALAGDAIAAARNLLAVDRQGDRAVLAGDAVVVPLGGRPRPSLAGQAPHRPLGMRPVGSHGGPLDREYIAVARIEVVVLTVEDLDLDGAREGFAHEGECIAPDEQPGVPLGDDVPVLELEDEVLVGPLGPQDPHGLAGGHDHAVAHRERLGRDVHRHPATQVLAVEQRPEIVVGPRPDRPRSARARAPRQEEPGAGFA